MRAFKQVLAPKPRVILRPRASTSFHAQRFVSRRRIHSSPFRQNDQTGTGQVVKIYRAEPWYTIRRNALRLAYIVGTWVILRVILGRLGGLDMEGVEEERKYGTAVRNKSNPSSCRYRGRRRSALYRLLAPTKGTPYILPRL